MNYGVTRYLLKKKRERKWEFVQILELINKILKMIFLIYLSITY